MEQFDTPGHVVVTIRNASGVVELAAEERGTTEVTVEALHPESEERARATRIEMSPTGEGEFRITVEVPRPSGWGESHGGVAVRVRMPQEADLRVSTASADVHAEGRFGRVALDSASGDIWLPEAIGDVVASTASGDVNIRRVQGSLRVHTASGTSFIDEVMGALEMESASGDQHVKVLGGRARMQGASSDILVGEVRDSLDAETASGNITIQQARGSLRLSARSGDVEVRRIVEGHVVASCASGDVSVGVAHGSRVRVDLDSRSGSVRSQIPLTQESDAGDGPLVEIEARTASGDVRVSAVG